MSVFRKYLEGDGKLDDLKHTDIEMGTSLLCNLLWSSSDGFSSTRITMTHDNKSCASGQSARVQ